MKRLLIALAALLLLLIIAMIWLAGSVGPETAPTDPRSIELTIPGPSGA